MAKEILTLGPDGNVGTEMVGFQGKDCLKAAAEIAAELERLGVVTEIGDLRMKDTAKVAIETQRTTMKVERG